MTLPVDTALFLHSLAITPSDCLFQAGSWMRYRR